MVEVLSPGIEARACAPGVFDGEADASVSPGDGGFEGADAGIGPRELDVPPSQCVLENLVLAGEVVARVLGPPLERRVGLGDEGGGADSYLQTPLPGAEGATAELDEPVHEVADGLDVVVGFGGQPDHEVELEPGPSGGEGRFGCGEEVILLHPLADDAAQARCARFRGEGQPGLAHALNRVGEGDGEGVHPQRGERDADAARAEAVDELSGQLLDARVVHAGEGKQRDLIVSGGGDGLFGLAQEGFRAAPAARPVDRAGLAEAAAARAAAHDFEGRAGVDGVDEGDYLAGWEGRGVQVFDNASDDALGRAATGSHGSLGAGAVEGGRVGAGDVDAGYRRELRECLSPIARGGGAGDLDDRLLPFSDEDGVEEVGEGLRVDGAGAAADDEWVAVGPVRRPERHAGQVEHCQHVGVGELVGQCDADGVELAQGSPGLKAGQGQVAGPELLLHVRPRCEGALGEEVLVGVEDMVENLEPQMGHPDIVDIGVYERDTRAH